MKRLCRNSNDYIRRVILPTRTYGLLYDEIITDISVEEMMRFLGIVLRISLNPLDYGGYEAYFNTSGIEIRINENTVMEAEGTGEWAVKYMSLKRFKIIRKAFHPEDRSARQCGDKCFHLRHLIRQFKSAAMYSFIPGRDIAFDEGCLTRTSHRSSELTSLSATLQSQIDMLSCILISIKVQMLTISIFILRLCVWEPR